MGVTIESTLDLTDAAVRAGLFISANSIGVNRMNILLFQATSPPRCCDIPPYRHRSVSTSQQFPVGCDEMREVVDVVELICPRRVKMGLGRQNPYPKILRTRFEKGV
jgi:hypothetical protein